MDEKSPTTRFKSDVNRANRPPPLERGESQLSTDMNERELFVAVKRDVERVFNLLLRRALTSKSFRIDDTELHHILCMLDVADEIGSAASDRVSRVGNSQNSYAPTAPANSTPDVRVHAVGQQAGAIPQFTVTRAKSDTLSQRVDNTTVPKSEVPSLNQRRKWKKSVKSAAQRRDLPFLRRIRRALHGLLQRNAGLEEDTFAASSSQAVRVEARESSVDSGLPSSSYSPVESDGKRGSPSENSSPQNALLKSSPRKKQLVAEIKEAGQQREHERSHRSAAQRRLSRVVSEIRAISKSKSKSKREHNSAESAKAEAAPSVSGNTQSVPVSAFLPSDTQPSESQSYSRAQSNAIKSPPIPWQSLPRYEPRKSQSSDHYRFPSNGRTVGNSGDALNLSGRLSDARAESCATDGDEFNNNERISEHSEDPSTLPIVRDVEDDERASAKNAALESIVNCVEHFVEHAQVGAEHAMANASVVERASAHHAPVAIAVTMTGSELTLEDKTGSLGKRKKAQTAPVDELGQLEEQREILDGQIVEHLRRCCTEASGLFTLNYTPDRLKRLDNLASEYLASSNYDLFKSAVRHEAHTSLNRRCSCADGDDSDVVRQVAQIRLQEASNSHSAPNSPSPIQSAESGRRIHVSESDNTLPPDDSVGFMELLYMARRAADVGVKTVSAVKNAKRNLVNYFCERYAQYIVDSGAWSALREDDMDFDVEPSASSN